MIYPGSGVGASLSLNPSRSGSVNSGTGIRSQVHLKLPLRYGSMGLGGYGREGSYASGGFFRVGSG